MIWGLPILICNRKDFLRGPKTRSLTLLSTGFHRATSIHCKTSPLGERVMLPVLNSTAEYRCIKPIGPPLQPRFLGYRAECYRHTRWKYYFTIESEI